MESTLHYSLIEEFQTSFENFLSDLELHNKLTDVNLDSSITKLEHLLDEERDTLSFRNNTRAGGIHVRCFIEWIHQQIKKLLMSERTVKAALRLIRALGKVEYSEPNEEVRTLSSFLQQAIFSDASPTGEVAKEAALILGECLLQPYQSNVVQSSHITELLQRVLSVLLLHERKNMQRGMPQEGTNTAEQALEKTPLSTRVEGVKEDKEPTREGEKKTRGTSQKESPVPTTPTPQPLDVRGTTLPYTDRPLFSPSASSPHLLVSKAEVVPAVDIVVERDRVSDGAPLPPLNRIVEDQPLSSSLPRRPSSSPPPTGISSPSSSSSAFSSFSGRRGRSTTPDRSQPPNDRRDHVDSEGEDGVERLSYHVSTSSTRPFFSRVDRAEDERHRREEEGEERMGSRADGGGGGGGRHRRHLWQQTLPCLFVLEQLVQYASAAVEAVLPDVMAGLLQSVRWGEKSLVRRTAAEILLRALRLGYRSPSAVYHPFQLTLLKCVARGLRGERRLPVQGGQPTHASSTSSSSSSSLERLDSVWEWECCFCGGGGGDRHAETSEAEAAREKVRDGKGCSVSLASPDDSKEGSVQDVPLSLANTQREEERRKDMPEAIQRIPPASFPKRLPALVQCLEGSLLLLNAVLASFTQPCPSIFLDYTACHRGTAPMCFVSSTFSHPETREDALPVPLVRLPPEKERERGMEESTMAGKTSRQSSPHRPELAGSAPIAHGSFPPPLPSGGEGGVSSSGSSVGVGAASPSGPAVVSLSRHALTYLHWIAQHISVCLLGSVRQSLCSTAPPSWRAQGKAREGRAGSTVGGGNATTPPHPPFSIPRDPAAAPPSSCVVLDGDETSSSSLSYASHHLILETLYRGTLPLLAVYDRSYFIHTTAVPVRKMCHEVMRRTFCRCSPRIRMERGKAGEEQQQKEEEAWEWALSSVSRQGTRHGRTPSGRCGREATGRLNDGDKPMDDLAGASINTRFMSPTELRSAHFILLTLLTWVVPEMIFTITASTSSSVPTKTPFVSCGGGPCDGEERHHPSSSSSSSSTKKKKEEERGEADAPAGGGVVEQENVLNTVMGYIKDTLMMEDAVWYAAHPSSLLGVPPSSSSSASALAPCPEAVTFFATMAEVFPRAVRPYSRSVMGPLFNKPLTSGFTRDVAKICAVFPGLRSTCLAKILQGASTLLQPLQPPLPILSSTMPSTFHAPLSRSTTVRYGSAAYDGGKVEADRGRRVERPTTTASSVASPYASVAGGVSVVSSCAIIVSIFDALHQMDFSGYSTLHFLCASILPFLTHSDALIRRRAVELCFQLVLSGCETNSPCQRLESGAVLHYGKEHTFLFLRIMKKLMYVALADMSPDLRLQTIRSFTVSHDYVLALLDPERLLAPLLFDTLPIAIAATRLIGRLSWMHPGGTYPALRRLLFQCVTAMHYAKPEFPKRYEHALTLLAVVAEAAPGLLPPYLRSLLVDVECRLRKCGASFPPSVLAAALSCAGKLSRLAVAAEDVMVVRRMQYTVVRHLLTTSSPPIRQESIRTLKDMIRSTKDVDLFFQLARMDTGHAGKGHLLPYLPFLSTAAPRLPPPPPALPPPLPASSIPYARLPAVLLGCLSGTLKERLSVRLDVLSLLGVLGALNPHSMKQLLQRASFATTFSSSSSSSSALAARPPHRRAPRANGGGGGGGDMEDGGGGQRMLYRGDPERMGIDGGGGNGGVVVEGAGRGSGMGGRNWRVHMGDCRAALYVDLAALDIGEEMDSPHVLHILLDTLHSPLLSAHLSVCAIDIVIHIIFLSTRQADRGKNTSSRLPPPPSQEWPHDRPRPRRDVPSSSSPSPPALVSFFGMYKTYEEVLHCLFCAIEEHEAERHRLLSQLVTLVSLMGRHIGPFTQNLLDHVLPYLSTTTPLSSSASATPSPPPSSSIGGATRRVSPRRTLPPSSSLSTTGGGDHHWWDGRRPPTSPPPSSSTAIASGTHGSLSYRPPSSSSSSSSSLECILQLFRVLQQNLKEELCVYLRDILPCLVHTVQVDVARAAVPIFRFYSQLGSLLDTNLHIVIGSVCDVASSAGAPPKCREEAARTLRKFGLILPSLLEESPRCIHCLCGILKDCSYSYPSRVPPPLQSPLPPSPVVGGGGGGGTLFQAALPRWDAIRLVTYAVEALAAMAWNMGSHFYKFVAMLEHILESYETRVKKGILSCVLGAANGDRDMVRGSRRPWRRGRAHGSPDSSTSEEEEEEEEEGEEKEEGEEEDDASDVSDSTCRGYRLEWHHRFFFPDDMESQKRYRHRRNGERYAYSRHEQPQERARGEHDKGGRHQHSHPHRPRHRSDSQREIEGSSKVNQSRVICHASVHQGKREGTRREDIPPHQARSTRIAGRSTTMEEKTERKPTEGGPTEQTHSPHSTTAMARKEHEKDEKESDKRTRLGEVENGGGGTLTVGDGSHPPPPPTVPIGASMKHLEMLLRFRTCRKTTEDWNQWTLQLAAALLDSSPSEVYRCAALLAEKHNTFAQRILHAAFQVLYDRGGETPLREELVRKLEEGLRDAREMPTEVLQELLNLSEFMERVWMRAKTWNETERNKVWPAKERLLFPVRVLADCSERCHLYAKALRYVELQILDVTDAQVGQRNAKGHRLLSSQEFTHLIELCGKSIYLYNLLGHRESAESALRFIEANFARFTGMKPSELPHCIDAELLEKLEWWSQSRSAYAAKLSVDPGNATYLAGYMRSIDKLGLYPEVLKEWIKRAPGLTPQDRQKIAPHAAHAAWLLRRWDHMKEITDNMSNEGYEGVTVHFYKAVVGVSKRELEVAEDHIQQCRRLMDSEISTLVAESYDRAYSLFVGIQQLSELEECILILKGGNTGRVPSVDRRLHDGGGNGAAAARSRHYLPPLIDRPPSHWQDIWERRLKSMAYEGWAGTLANHEFLVPQMEELHLWLQFAAMSRQHRYYTIANEVLFQLRGHRSVEEAMEEEMRGNTRSLASTTTMKTSPHSLATSPETTTTQKPKECSFLPSLALASFQHMYDTQPSNREYTRHLLDQYIRLFYSASPGVLQQYFASKEERSSVALCHSKMAYWLFKQKWTEEVDTSRRESSMECGPLRRGGGNPQSEISGRHRNASPPPPPPLSPLSCTPSLPSSVPPVGSDRTGTFSATGSHKPIHQTGGEDATRDPPPPPPRVTPVEGFGSGCRTSHSAYEHAATVREILAHLDAATHVDAGNGLIWHAWGTIHTSMARAAATSAVALAKRRAMDAISPSHREDPTLSIDPSQRQADADVLVGENECRRKCLVHVMEALKGYVKSLCLMRELEDALGCLSLWFEYGDQLGFEDGRKLLEELLLQVPTTVWLKLKPQIVARLQQKENVSSFVSDSVFRLLEHVAEEHPHALLYTLIVAKASYALATQNGDGETLPNFSCSETMGSSAGGAAAAATGERIRNHSSSTGSALPPSSKTGMKKMPTAAPAGGSAFPSTTTSYPSPALPTGPSVSRAGGAAARLLQSIKKAHHILLPTLVEDAELVCREVVRCAATWTEKWLVAMERMKECEMENYSKTLRLVVRPLVLELSSPETESEKQFADDFQRSLIAWWKAISSVPAMGDTYRYEVEVSFQPLHQQLRRQCDTLLSRTTELSSFSRSLAKDGRNLSAVVPGEYDPERADFTMACSRYNRSNTPHLKSTDGSSPPNRWSGIEPLRGREGENRFAFSPPYLYQPSLIACFDDKMEVLKTKQRPRRMSIHSTDGICYHFLLKGQGDLRLDERVMQLLSFVNTLLEKHGATQQRDCAIQTYSVTPLSESAGLVGWVSDCNTMYEYVSAYRHDDPNWLTLEANTILEHAPVLPRHRPEERTRWLSTLRRIQMLELLEEAHAVTTGNDLSHTLWMRAPSAETWLDRRTTYVCSLATMSMVGHVMGLGDRHPSNILFHAYSGRAVHIDFGDCFEVAHLRKVDPENVPFRLTRMLIKVLEVGGIHGLFRHSCVTTMHILRKEGSSILALLEAFVHDPLVTWGMEDEEEEEEDSRRIGREVAVDQRDHQNMLTTVTSIEKNRRPSASTSTEKKKIDKAVVPPLMATQSYLRRRRRRRETGTVLYHARLLQTNTVSALPRIAEGGSIPTTAKQVVHRIQEKLEGLEFHDGGRRMIGRTALGVEAQVQRLIDEACSSENVAVHYRGWCPFW